MTQASPLIPLIRKLVASVGAALGALVITVGVMTYLTWQSTLWVRHTREVQSTGTRALDLALDRHASIGAYLVTNDSAVLAPSGGAQVGLWHEIGALRRLVRDNPEQESRLALVAAAVGEWESTYVNRVVQARDSTERARIGREEQAGTASFVKVRSIMESFLNEEAALYAQRVQQNKVWRASEIVLVLIEALVILVALTHMRRELLSHATRTLEQQTLLEEQAIELEAQAAEQEMLTADLQVANQELMDAGME
ncbi:MAG TPA: CHASE3 domain-containing protein, partial [Gemmatimonadaceae bacterium]